MLTIATITDVITILSCYCIVLSTLLIIKGNKEIGRIWPVIFFITCTFLYLIIDFFSSELMISILVAGPFLLPPSFWVLSKSLFSDNSIRLVPNLFMSLFVLVIYYVLSHLLKIEYLPNIVAFIARVISLFFVNQLHVFIFCETYLFV